MKSLDQTTLKETIELRESDTRTDLLCARVLYRIRNKAKHMSSKTRKPAKQRNRSGDCKAPRLHVLRPFFRIFASMLFPLRPRTTNEKMYSCHSFYTTEIVVKQHGKILEHTREEPLGVGTGENPVSLLPLAAIATAIFKSTYGELLFPLLSHTPGTMCQSVINSSCLSWTHQINLDQLGRNSYQVREHVSYREKEEYISTTRGRKKNDIIRHLEAPQYALLAPHPPCLFTFYLDGEKRKWFRCFVLLWLFLLSPSSFCPVDPWSMRCGGIS